MNSIVKRCLEMGNLIANIAFDILIMVLAYKYGKHRGEVEKHAEIFGLIREKLGWDLE